MFNPTHVVSCDIRQTAVGIAPGLWYVTDPNSAYVGWVCRAVDDGYGLVAIRYGTEEDRKLANRPILDDSRTA